MVQHKTFEEQGMTESVSLRYKLGVAVAAGLVLAACATYVGGLLRVRVPIWLVDVFMWGALAMAILVVLVAHRRHESGSRAPSEDPVRSVAGRALILLPFSVLLPGIGAVLQSTRLQMSFHGFLHSAYTYQIVNGVVPPENPFLPGHPANDYWLFHVLIAGLVHSLRVAPPLIAIVVNLIALTVSTFLIAGILTRLRLWPTSPVAKGLAVLFVLFGLNLVGLANAWGSDSGLTDPDLAHMVHIGGARSAGLFGKFLNFNGFPLGVAFFLLSVSSGLRLTKGFDAWPLVGFVSGLLGALAFHVTTGAFAFATLPAALVISILFIRHPRKLPLSRARMALIAATTVVASVLLGHYVLVTAAALNDPTEIDPLNARNVSRLLLLTAPLIPFFVLGAVHAFRERRRDLLMLSLTTVGGAILAWGLLLPGGNQYKFDYLSTLPMAVVALEGWRVLRRSERAWLPKLAILAVVLATALTLGNQVYMGLAYIDSSFARNDSIASKGRDVVGARAGTQAEAWEWLRENSSPDAIVVLPVISKNDAAFLAISQRLPYVMRGAIYTSGYPDFEDRTERVRVLYSERTSVAVKREIIAAIRHDIGDRPLFIAVPRANASAVTDAVLGSERVFTSKQVSLYRLGT